MLEAGVRDDDVEAAEALERGFDVLAMDLRPDPDGPGTPYQADLTSAAANEKAIAAAMERFGGLDVIVAGAGIQHIAPIQEYPVSVGRPSSR